MSALSQSQIDFIRNDLKKKSLSRSFLFNEYVDHVCCDVEDLMGRDMSFEDAYATVTSKRRDTDVSNAHRDVQQFLNHPYVGIKKILLLSFLLFAVSWVINIRGLTQWTGLVSFAVLGLVYLRIAFDFFAKRRIRRSNVMLGIFSILSFIGTISGIFLLFLVWNYGINTRGHGVDLTVFGWFFFSLICLMYYIRETGIAIDKGEIRKMKWFGWLSGLHVLLSLMSIASFPLFPYVQDLLFWFILIILGFDLLMIVFLLLNRSMKHTLMVSLVLGSFMIVFIHSHFRARLPGGAPKPELHHISLQYEPGEAVNAERLYISMYYSKFPERPITLPLQKSGSNQYEIRMPSYPYKGGLIYGITRDSIEAPVYFNAGIPRDSILLNVPKTLTYRLTWKLKP